MITAHIRDEGNGLLDACREFIGIVKASGAKGVLSHHKAMYKQNWGKVAQTLAMIDMANREGCDIYLDTYPYIASHTSIYSKFIPKEYCSGGNEALAKRLTDPTIREQIRKTNLEKYGDDDLSWCVITVCPAFPEYIGLSLDQIAAYRGTDVYDAVFDLISQSKNECRACNFLMCEEDLEKVLAHPRCMICTDSSVQGNSRAYHPRLRGSFPRTLGRYVRQRQVVALPEMIRKMTALPAQVYALPGKGLLKEGYDTDICIFDADKIIDCARFVDCHERAQGLNYVLVNGQIAAENAVSTGIRAGRILP